MLISPWPNSYHFLCYRGRSTIPCFIKEYHVKTVIQSDIDAVFANNSCLKIIETRFAEQFWPLTGWGLQL